jgi:hypothetical protein
MATRPVHRTLPAAEALEDRCLLSANGIFPPAAPVCPSPGSVTQQSGAPSGVSDQVPLIPTVSVDIGRHVHVPGRHKTVPLRPIHHGLHFQTALGAILHAGGTGSLFAADTPGGAQDPDKPGTPHRQHPGDKVQRGPEDPNFWLDLADRWDALADRKQKEADGLPDDDPNKEKLTKQAKRYRAMADWCREKAIQASDKAANAQQGPK